MSEAIRRALAEGSITIDLTESECERCGERHELTTTETGRVLCEDHYLAETGHSLDTPP